MLLVSVIGYFLPSKSEGFDSLADLIVSHALITLGKHFVSVPGVTVNLVLLPRPLLSSFTAQLRSKISKVHLTSNPYRLKSFEHEIVVFRDDLTSHMLQNFNW